MSNTSEPDESRVQLKVKWKKQIFEIEIELCALLQELQERLCELTGVPEENQKVMGIKKRKGEMKAVRRQQQLQRPAHPMHQGGGEEKEQQNSTYSLLQMTLEELGVNGSRPLMLLGDSVAAKERFLEATKMQDRSSESVRNDLEQQSLLVAAACNPVYLDKVEVRIREYEPVVLSEARPGKKLLVLDVDYTLFDHRTPAEHALQLRRPYLLEFLASAYVQYDIIIWSATSMKWIRLKMDELGVTACESFSILAYFDFSAMISVETEENVVKNVKPLAVVWAKFPEYNSTNTIMFDDIRRNFVMNPQNGLRIHAFRNAPLNQDDDTLLRLSEYLELIARLPSFDQLDHDDWKLYVRRHRARHRE